MWNTAVRGGELKSPSYKFTDTPLTIRLISKVEISKNAVVMEFVVIGVVVVALAEFPEVNSSSTGICSSGKISSCSNSSNTEVVVVVFAVVELSGELYHDDMNILGDSEEI